MKTIHALLVLLLFTSFSQAQTNTPGKKAPARTAPGTNVAPKAPPAFPAFPAVRQNVPVRGGTNSSTRATTATSANPTSPAVPSPGANATVNPPAPGATNPATSATVAAPASAAPMRTNDAGEVANITYDFPQLPLEQALQIYSGLVNRTILRSPQVQPTLQLTLKTENPLTKSEAITAWETIFGMNNITVVPIGEKFMKIVQEAQAGNSGGEFSKASADELPEAGRFVTHIVQLKYAMASDVQAAIQPFAKNPAAIVAIPNSNTLILRDYSENVKRMLEVIEKLDTVDELKIKPEVIPIKYALASDIQQVLGSLTASGPGVSVGRSTRGPNTTANGYQPGAPGQMGIPGQPNPQPGSFGSPMGSAATSGRSRFQQNLQNIVSRIASGAGDFQVLGAAKIIADDRTNSLLIFANDQDMVMIKTIISQLDVVLAQVLIEAIVMEVSLDDSQTIGVSWLQQPQKIGGFTGAGGLNNGQTFLDPKNFVASVGTNATGSSPVGINNLPSGFSYFGKFGNDFDVALAAIANDNRVNVLSRPRIQTSHAVPATLFIGDTVPYITGTSYGDYGVIGGARSQYQEKRVGITLDVLPLINPDGLVVMDIQENIQQLGPNQTIDGNPVPTTTERSASAKVAVRDRETIILGGFISSSKSKSKSGIPYLKDIPLLGALFRSTTDSNKRVELIILMRPTVLPTPEAAALVAAGERDKLPGVKQAEFEIREAERKRQEKIDAEMRKKMGLRVNPL